MKSSMILASHRGMIIDHARFSRSAAADGTGYVAFKKQLSSHENTIHQFSL
ncbi:hypothetical protein U3A58_03760 [Algoriphagus sp. C2-6-M1]|uniref:hypothetical protein n=1 Tax=Algoriphagus persicinus TaxID=3108754 RepID=UPI002B3CAAE9|nr:hypothetical protein [Algoriphagus sp. C2-6-M1]MEB2779499.1 hypothetical protein [Algoriphagus sp. C2-6-M1]